MLVALWEWVSCDFEDWFEIDFEEEYRLVEEECP
jgi:hypothetical protein